MSTDTDIRGVPREPLVVVVLRALALASAVAATLLELSLPAGTVGAVLATLAATFAAGYVARSPLRLGAVWLIAAGAAAMGLLLGAWLVDGSIAPRILGPAGAMAAGDLVRFSLLACAVVLVLRTTTLRWAPFAVAEVAMVALALASVVAAHRDGAINHPRALSDWALTTDHDPVRIFLYIGVGTTIALVVALLRERRGRGARAFLHLAAAALLALLVLSFIRIVGLPHSMRGGGLGKDDQSERGKGKDRRGGRGGQGGSSGQMNSLQFRDDYSPQQKDVPVAVVVLHDDYSPPLGYYYFRQTAFSQYNGHRLVATTRDDADRDIVADFPTEMVKVPDPPKEGPERKELRSSVYLLADHVKPFGLETPVEFTPVESPDPTRFLRAYDVDSEALAMKYEDLLGKKAFTDSWSEDLRRAYTELPDDPRYKQLADKIIDTTLREEYRHDPFAQALAISAWLSDNSIYSRRSKHSDAVDPTADFLFGEPDPVNLTGRVGYCVHFAHAAAFLLRARGLPARIAAGYVADEGRKGSGSTIMLRERDAHAWAELHLDGFGWIIVDVAPKRTLDPPETPTDQDLQRMLGELARKTPPPPHDPHHATDLLDRLLTAVEQALPTILLAALLCLYLIKIWRLAAPRFTTGAAQYRVAYRAALDRLGEAGFRREHGETREAFADRLASIAPTLRVATVGHLGHAFGGTRLPSPDEMRRLARDAAAAAVMTAPWWRRVFGGINPISWMFTR